MNTTTLPNLELANAHFVTDYLAVGGDLDQNSEHAARRQALELSEAGITHVLDVRFETKEDLWDEFSEVTYTWDGIDDAGQLIDWAWFDEVADWARAALRVPGARLLTHCHMGINRGPSTGLLVLLTQGWDPIEALDAIRSARPIAAIAYADQVVAWHLVRAGAKRSEALATMRRVDRWFDDHPMDVVRIIAEQRRMGL